MQKEAYIQASTRVRMAEKDLLTHEQLLRMAEADSIESLNRLLSETSYQQEVSKLDNPEDYEQMLANELKKTYNFLYEISPDPRLVDLFTGRYVYHNMKVLAKEIIMEKDMGDLYIPFGDLPIDDMKKAAEAGTLRRVERYGEELSSILKDYEDHKQAARIDVLADQFYAKRLIDTADALDLPIAKNYAMETVDLYNVMILLRARNLNLTSEEFERIALTGGNIYLPEVVGSYYENQEQIIGRMYSMPLGTALRTGLSKYEQTKTLSAFEKTGEDHFIELAKQTKLVSYGPEVLVSYLIAKENEIKNLRILYVSIRNGIPRDKIKERLRNTYA